MQAATRSYISKERSDALSPQHLSALMFATAGFKVLPLWPNSKKPMTANGYKAGTTDFCFINRRWKKCPKANVAICTDGLLVLDIDVKGGVDGYAALAQLEAKYGTLPVTRSQVTPSGGQHLIFRTDADISCSKNCPADGIDVRAGGGYIVAHGSVIDSKSYVMDDTDIAVAPQWLVDLTRSSNDDAYSYHGASETCINLENFNDVVTITGMGQSITVKYDPDSNTLQLV